MENTKWMKGGWQRVQLINKWKKDNPDTASSLEKDQSQKHQEDQV